MFHYIAVFFCLLISSTIAFRGLPGAISLKTLHQRSAMELFDRLTGTVRSFNSKRGFGFINPADGSPEVFVHYLDIKSEGFKSLLPGDNVEFDVAMDSTNRRRATDVSGPGGTLLRSNPPPPRSYENNIGSGGGYQQQSAFGGGGYNGQQQRYQRPGGYNNNYNNNGGNSDGNYRGGGGRRNENRGGEGGGGRGGYSQAPQQPAMFEQDAAFGNMPQQVDDYMSQNYNMPLDDMSFDESQ